MTAEPPRTSFTVSDTVRIQPAEWESRAAAIREALLADDVPVSDLSDALGGFRLADEAGRTWSYTGATWYWWDGTKWAPAQVSGPLRLLPFTLDLVDDAPEEAPPPVAPMPPMPAPRPAEAEAALAPAPAASVPMEPATAQAPAPAAMPAAASSPLEDTVWIQPADWEARAAAIRDVLVGRSVPLPNVSAAIAGFRLQNEFGGTWTYNGATWFWWDGTGWAPANVGGPLRLTPPSEEGARLLRETANLRNEAAQPPAPRSAPPPAPAAPVAAPAPAPALTATPVAPQPAPAAPPSGWGPAAATPAATQRKKGRGCFATGCLFLFWTVVVIVVVALAIVFKVPQAIGLTPDPQKLLEGTPDREAAAALLQGFDELGYGTAGMELYILPVTDETGLLAYAVLDSAAGYEFPLTGASGADGNPIFDVMIAIAQSPIVAGSNVEQIAIEYRDLSGERVATVTAKTFRILDLAAELISVEEFTAELYVDVDPARAYGLEPEP